MLFGLVNLENSSAAEKSAGLKTTPVLCLLPDKPSSFSVPVPIESMILTDFAVQFLSVEEGFLATRESGSQGIVLSAIHPAKLYLSPNRPERPGFSVSKVKVERGADGTYKVMFDRDRGWEPWTPNVKLY